MPGTNSIPASSHAAAAAAQPATVSWSVTLSTVTPAAFARATSSPGEHLPSEAVVCVWRSIIGERSSAGNSAARGRPARGARRRALARAQRAILADQEIQMDALFVGELQEHALAFRFLEALAVAFEELVRSALALDADEERLLVVHALAQFLRAFGEQPAGGALEKQKCRPRLELGVAGDQLAIPFF